MSLDPIKIKSLRALNKDVLITSMHFGERQSSSGIILTNDDGKMHGVRPRWGKVYAIGPKQTDIEVGQWILIEHGRWSRKIKIDDGSSIHEIQKVDTDCILAVSNEEPKDDFVSDSL